MGDLTSKMAADTLDLVNNPQLQVEYYSYIHVARGGRREPRWRGIRVIKFPADLVLYAQVIQKRKPRFIIETGTAYGGSSLFFVDMLRLIHPDNEHWGVITVDVNDNTNGALKGERRITQIIGSSVDEKVVGRIRENVYEYPVMAVLDSDHSTRHVLAELNTYKNIVTKGQYMVVEDCWTRRTTPYYPFHAVNRFMEENQDYRRIDVTKQFIFAVSRDGWLRRER